MFRLLWTISVRVRIFMWRYMPTNILLHALRTRRGLRWAVPAMLLAAPYFVAAWLCSTSAADGGPGWLNLLVLLFIWNAFKFIANGPVTLVLLARVRLLERQMRKAYDRDLGGYELAGQIGSRAHSISA